MPTATRNIDGSVLVDGVRLTADQVLAISNAQNAPAVSGCCSSSFKPMSIITFSGRRYGDTGPARYGIWFSTRTNKWSFLDKNGILIPNTSWKAKNLSRAKFTFNKPA